MIALSARFVHTGTAADLAARLGKISALSGLKYWSRSKAGWRTLISDAFALEGPTIVTRRPDFTGEEVLSGDPLFMAQNDTRSTGANVFQLEATSPAADRMTVSMVNLSDIWFLVSRLFRSGDLVSVHFVRRLRGDEWGYYGLTVVKHGWVRGREKSFINRAAAYQRLVTGLVPDGYPPIAP